MSRQVRVSDKVTFVGAANTGASWGGYGNIDGHMKESLYHRLYEFDEDTMNADHWATSVGNGGAVAINAAANGTVRLTANTGADDNVAEMQGEAVIYGAQSPRFEIRLKVDNITTVGICAGLVDAYANTNDQIKFEISGTTIVDRGTTPDAVAWVFDTDATTDQWHCCNSKAGTQAGTICADATAPTNATYEVLGIEIDGSTGDATFYRNGVPQHFKAAAVTAAHAYRPYVGLIVRASAARNLDIDYIEVWQNRFESSSVVA